jgi:hypothetical protein
MNNEGQNSQHDPHFRTSSMDKLSLNESLHVSPIRKDLIKNLCKYYVLLKETENLDARGQRKKSKSGPDSPGKLKSHQTLVPIDPSNKTPYQQFISDLQVYDESTTRNSRLDELKNLMKAELGYVESGHQIDPTYSDMQNSIQGYPSFMTDPEANSRRHFKGGVHYKNQHDYGEGRLSEYREDLTSILKHLTEGVQNENDSESLENHLLSLQIRKKMIIKTLGDREKYDFHQRKGKEIRRLQYGCQVKDASEDRLGKPRLQDLDREIMNPCSAYNADPKDARYAFGSRLAEGAGGKKLGGWKHASPSDLIGASIVSSKSTGPSSRGGRQG